MAVTNFSPLLGLALPDTGDLSGTWGDVVNDSITSLLDSAVAGTTTLNTDADVTLSTTTGVSNQSRSAVILWTANGTVTRNITAPAQSKAYVVINKTAGTQSIVLRGVGPTTGVTVAANRKALVAWNGVDFVEVAGGPINLTSDVTGVLPTANGGTGLSTVGTENQTLKISSGVPAWGTVSLTAGVNGVLPTANGGTGLSSVGSEWQVLQVNGGVPAWGLVSLTSNVTGTLPTSNGGTGLSSVGSDGQVLTVSSGVPAWVTPASGLPSQTGNAGKYLTTDGTNASWGTLITPGGGGAIAINNDVVTSSYTIAAGTNGFSVGPITVASGQSVTVSSGQRWVVL